MDNVGIYLKDNSIWVFKLDIFYLCALIIEFITKYSIFKLKN